MELEKFTITEAAVSVTKAGRAALGMQPGDPGNARDPGKATRRPWDCGQRDGRSF